MSSRPTVLLIEDHDAVRRIIRKGLERAGFEVMEAVDGRSALESARFHAPDVVVSDVVLPDMRGDQLVKTLRALLSRDVSIIALTGLPLDSFERGAFDIVLSKPVRLGALGDILWRQMGRQVQHLFPLGTEAVA